MSTRTKIVLSIGAMCLVAVMSIAAVVAVFAARQQTIQSSINVSYTAKEVEAMVKANWYEGSGSAQPMKVGGSSSGDDSINFTAGGPSQTGALSPTKETIELSESNNYVVFEYIFENTGKEFIAKLSYADDGNSADENVNIYAGCSDNGTQKTTSNLATGDSDVKKLENKQSGDFLTFTVPNGKEGKQTWYAYVVIAINAIGDDAGFSGTFTWDLTSTGK